tara:strand:- start:233 stop:394 length:162 start_codon:yes stop_codon:yes gene_type:complete
MVGLDEEIGRITTLLEDAKEEQDWNAVQKCIDALDDLYDKLERGNGFGDFDYD